jgi:hypothetical protein
MKTNMAQMHTPEDGASCFSALMFCVIMHFEVCSFEFSLEFDSNMAPCETVLLF